MIIVSLSGKRRSGKSTLANLLQQEYGYHPVNLADPLKSMCREFYGLTHDQTDGCLKEQPTQYRDFSLPGRTLFWTPRQIMIHVGQSFRKVDPDFWLKQLFNKMALIDKMQTRIFVVADVRFLNEMRWMKEHQAICVRLERNEILTGPNINDPSETELDTYQDWDIKIPADENVDMSDLARIGDMINAHVTAKLANSR